MTACAIGYYTEDNNIRAIYCANDGDVGSVGIALLRDYADSWETVEDLVNQGNIQNFWGDGVEYLDDDTVSEYATETEYIREASKMGCKYIYLFLELDFDDAPTWSVACPDTEFVPIVDRMMIPEEGYIHGVA